MAAVREYLDALLVAGLAALFLLTFVLRTFYIPSVSMVPTLKVGDVLIADEIAYRFHAPQDGDVAIFTPPVPSNGDEFVKRVIGTPGETMRIADGVVYRNGIALREPYENQPPRYDLRIERYGIYVDGVALDPHNANVPPRSQWRAPNRIPDGYYLMLGDNRNYSDDSHVWGFAQSNGTFSTGPLAGRRAGFAGRVFAIFWPLSRLQVVR
ncbi:MAG: signal peptidase I [Candidatus Tumulicola sp.]